MPGYKGHPSFDKMQLLGDPGGKGSIGFGVVHRAEKIDPTLLSPVDPVLSVDLPTSRVVGKDRGGDADLGLNLAHLLGYLLHQPADLIAAPLNPDRLYVRGAHS